MSSMVSISYDDLPADIIRRIIPLTGEPHKMKQVSRTWNALSLEYLAKQQRIPIEEVSIWVKSITQISIYVKLHKEHLSFVSFPKNWEVTCEDNINVASASSPFLSVRSTFSVLKKLFECCSSISKICVDNLHWKILDILERCLDPHIGVLKVGGMSFSINSEEYDGMSWDIVDLAHTHGVDAVITNNETL